VCVVMYYARRWASCLCLCVMGGYTILCSSAVDPLAGAARCCLLAEVDTNSWLEKHHLRVHLTLDATGCVGAQLWASGVLSSCCCTAAGAAAAAVPEHTHYVHHITCSTHQGVGTQDSCGAAEGCLQHVTCTEEYLCYSSSVLLMHAWSFQGIIMRNVQQPRQMQLLRQIQARGGDSRAFCPHVYVGAQQLGRHSWHCIGCNPAVCLLRAYSNTATCMLL
jgi:hypothetical protein